MDAKTKKYLVIAAVLGLTAVGLFVRVRGLSAYYFSPDEAMDIWMSEQPTLARVWRIAAAEPHPPLRYLIQHSMIAVGRDRLFLRCFSLVPGIGLIALFFALGRRASGTAAGLTMAAMAAFGFGPVLVSDAMRVYPLAAVAQTLALLCWLAYRDDHRPARLLGFSLAVVVALLCVYVQAIPIAAVYAAWVLVLAARRQPAREYRALALTTMPMAAAVVLIYFIHGQYLLHSNRFANPAEPWLDPFFFSDLRGLGANLYDLFGWLTLPPLAAPALLLTVAGLVVLWRRGRAEVVVAFALALGLNVLATLAGKFPLGGTRHSFHFFPLVALAVGAAVQAGWDRVRGRASLGRLIARRPMAVPAAGIALFIAATLALVWGCRRSDYLRRYGPESWRELPIMTEEYQAGMTQFLATVRPGDLVFASYQTVIYQEMDTGRHWTPAAANLGRLNAGGLDWFFVTRNGAASAWLMPPADETRQAVLGLALLQGLQPDRRVWILNFGWTGTVDWMATDPWWSARADRVLETYGVGIYMVPAEKLR